MQKSLPRVNTAMVSILIPTYNQSSYLLQAVESALHQDYERLEVIVCDDASSDWDEDLLKKFVADPRLRIHRNPHNLGRVKNYRQGLYELAKGDWVLVLDGDDFLQDHTYVSKAMAIAASDPDIDLVFSNALRLIEDRGGILEPAVENKDLPPVMTGPDLFLRLAGKKSISLFHNTAIYRREKAVNLDFYRRDIISSDWESLHRYILTGKVAFVNTNASVWRIHQDNATQTISAQERGDNLQAVIDPFLAAKTLGLFSGPVLDAWFETRLWKTARLNARTLLLAKDLKGYTTYLRTLKMISPEIERRIRRSPKLLVQRIKAYLPHTSN
jgi:glycosyltransferase involved in cell wall biosynthesis